MFELDVGQVPPVVLREGIISKGQFDLSDVGVMDNKFDCVLGGITGGGAAGLFTNCGWAHCVAAAATAAVVGV